MNDPTNDQARELLGAYALGAVGDDEAAAVERLLLEDQDARAELHALQLGGSWLASADPRPAPHVWAGIAEEIARDAQDELAAHRRARRRWRVLAVAAAVVAAVVVATALLVQPSDDRRRVAAPAVVVLADDAGAPRLEMSMTDDGAGRITTSRLEPLDDETYQLWAISDDSIRSVAVLGDNPTGERFRVPPDTERLAVTREPLGGSTRPTTEPLASGDVT